MGQAGITENPARLLVVILVDEYPTWKDPKRTLDDAHVLIQHQMMDVGSVEQRADS